MMNNKLTENVCGICANCVPQIDGGSGFKTCAEAHAAEQEDCMTGEYICGDCGCDTGNPEYIHYCREDNSND
jgi:hypothetical protein